MSSSGDIWPGRRRHNTPQFNDVVAICQLVYCVRVCPRGQTRSLETVDGRQNGAVSKRESISDTQPETSIYRPFTATSTQKRLQQRQLREPRRRMLGQHLPERQSEKRKRNGGVTAVKPRHNCCRSNNRSDLSKSFKIRVLVKYRYDALNIEPPKIGLLK